MGRAVTRSIDAIYSARRWRLLRRSERAPVLLSVFVRVVGDVLR
jgi:hypothetical protein